ncbi:hypothetical protein C3943_25460 [Lysinibacillus sp. B2A1]|nr:hypothetical protein C3943_25460 [Lysinibacillus sp. B2A1]
MVTLLVYSESVTTNSEIEVSLLSASFGIDVNNVNAVVGDADNVFVGYVEKLEGTEYKYPVTIETEVGTKEVSSPYTNYSITVIDNIKGKLKKNISVQKSGGISQDQDVYLLYEGDSLPVEGRYYIFNTYNQPDGSILISGPNSNIELNINSKSEILSSEEYKKYVEAVKNEVKSDRKRFESDYTE